MRNLRFDSLLVLLLMPLMMVSSGEGGPLLFTDGAEMKITAETATIFGRSLQEQHNDNQRHRQQQEEACTLCYDGSTPNIEMMSARYNDATCEELAIAAANYPRSGQDCARFQVEGYQDCGCPSFPPGFCFLCPGGSSNIPDLNKVVQANPENLTCSEILYLDEDLLDDCSALDDWQDHCGCPTQTGEACSFCDSGSDPVFTDRVIPYLSGEQPMTCGVQALSAARSSGPAC